MSDSKHIPQPTHHPVEAEADDVDAAPQELAGMIPAQLLQPGEIIILLIKPSILYIILEPLRSLTAVALIGICLTMLAARDWLGSLNRTDMILLTIAVLGVRLTWQFLEWLSRTYVLTDRRVLRVKGVLRIQVFEATLKQIQHTNTTFNLRERFFGLGSITFATAGTGFPEAAWEMIANPLQVHEQVIRALNRYR